MGTIVCILALLLAGHGLGLIIKMRMFCLLIKRVETKYIKKIDGIVVDVDTYVKDGSMSIAHKEKRALFPSRSLRGNTASLRYMKLAGARRILS